MMRRWWTAGLVGVLLVYLHNTLPYLTTMPRVNVDEPWLMERAYQVMRTGVPSQPMLGLRSAYLLQVGYGYLLALWMSLFGVGLFQARMLSVCLGFGIIVMVASIGRRTIDAATGLSAALFLALDSNFLGGVRDARTDIPSLFFAVGAFAAYVRGRGTGTTIWFLCAGASLGLAVLCHGNAFWAGLILVAWFFLDYQRRAPRLPYGYAVLAGVLLTLGPYLAVVLARWTEVQGQIANFAADRVPGWRPSFVLQQVLREAERYRGWYFGLVTALVPNPLLRFFQAAILAGIAALVVRAIVPRRGEGEPIADARGPIRLLILAAGAAVIFAGLVNNKVPVYLPHIMVGFALAAGFGVSELVSAIPRLNRRAATLVFLLGYGATGVAYYEKWYSRERTSELVAYEETEATLRAMVPAGPKYLFASPQFWTPFHDQPDTAFYSYTAAHPIDVESAMTLPGASDDRPIVLVIDEYQWLPELIGVTSSTPEWQRTWISFIEQRCALQSVALGTAHGTLAAYRCALGAAPAGTAEARIVGGATEYRIGEQVLKQDASALAGWLRYDDPRRAATAHPNVRATADGLRISGTGWPGIVKMFRGTPGAAYLVRTTTAGVREGDLLYLGTWQQRQVRSLSGAGSAGIPAPLFLPRWFPRDRAFRATAADVRVLVYSEAPTTDFTVSSLEIDRLLPASPAVERRR
jgi:4-amino-4-deoxy-L-arabinose transferase-like glycosyltransferase